MAKKIFLSPSNQTSNAYAYGNTTEDVQCGKIATACKTALERCGFEVKLEHYDTMQNKVSHSDSWGADLHVPIHTNACNGKTGGTRIFYYNTASDGYKASKAVFDVLKGITPGTSDSMSAYPTLYEVKNPKAPTVYVEAEFHDVSEYAKWIINNTTKIGEAICEGICNYYGVKYVNTNSNSNSDSNVLYRVQVGAYKNKDNAEAMLSKLKAAGFEGYIKQ